MNKEKYNQIIDEIYNKYTTKYMGYDDVPSKELFLFEIKNNPEFSEKWGLKIEERELSLNERVKLYGVEKINTTDAGYYEHSYAQSEVDEANIPTKLITLTYNNEKIETYE